MNIDSEIVKWYMGNQRELPWRKTKDPYKIWVSEVILQQTRVEQALEYYKNFLCEFPDVQSLAKAELVNVLKVWQGLGYYSRARNMHHSAKFIMNELNGKFPIHYSEIIKLKGIGEYTAAAIASFAHNERVPAIDGNVYRVISRLFAEKSTTNSSQGKKTFKKLAEELIKYQEPELFNQAMMEFGAIQCIPRNPNCLECPLNSVCMAYQKHEVEEFPVKIRALKKKERYFNYFFVEIGENTYIKQRDKQDIWQGLFEFPMIETASTSDFTNICLNDEWKSIFNNSPLILHSVSNEIIHLLTHQKIHAFFYRLSSSSSKNIKMKSKAFIKIKIDHLKRYPVPKIIENFIKTIEQSHSI
jgi:A/G-specific adenine glycosylase